MSTNFGKFESFVPYIIDTVVEAGPDDVVRAIQRTVRKMVRDTEFFTEEYTQDVVAGTTVYYFDSEYDAKNLRVRIILTDGATVNNNDYALSVNGRTVTLATAPAETVVDGFELKTSILPDLDCLELNEDQMERWAEAIIALSKSDLHSQPRKPWTDPLEAQVQSNLYEGYVELMAQDRISNGQSGSTSINLGARI